MFPRLRGDGWISTECDQSVNPLRFRLCLRQPPEPGILMIPVFLGGPPRPLRDRFRDDNDNTPVVVQNRSSCRHSAAGEAITASRLSERGRVNNRIYLDATAGKGMTATAMATSDAGKRRTFLRTCMQWGLSAVGVSKWCKSILGTVQSSISRSLDVLDVPVASKSSRSTLSTSSILR